MNPSFGLGLRPPFYAEAALGKVPVDWFELITENFMVPGGNPLRVLEGVRRHYPVALHGVSMNLGGTDPLDESYLDDLATLVRRVEPLWVSDHLCWTAHGRISCTTYCHCPIRNKPSSMSRAASVRFRSAWGRKF